MVGSTQRPFAKKQLNWEMDRTSQKKKKRMERLAEYKYDEVGTMSTSILPADGLGQRHAGLQGNPVTDRDEHRASYDTAALLPFLLLGHERRPPDRSGGPQKRRFPLPRREQGPDTLRRDGRRCGVSSAWHISFTGIDRPNRLTSAKMSALQRDN